MIRWLENKRLISVILTILVGITIYQFSSIPGSGIPGIFNGQSIIYHFTIFFLFSFFLLISIKGNKKVKSKYILITLIISILYAFLDEYHQMFVPLRSPSIGDILTNFVGVLSSMIYFMARNQ